MAGFSAIGKSQSRAARTSGSASTSLLICSGGAGKWTRPLISPSRTLAAMLISPPSRMARQGMIDSPPNSWRRVSSSITSAAMRREKPESSWVLLVIQVPMAGQTSGSAFKTMVEGMAQPWRCCLPVFLLFVCSSGLVRAVMPLAPACS